MIFLLDPSYSALINLRLIQLWQVSLPLLQSSVSTFFTLGTLIKQIHLWNCWLPLTGQSTRKILDRFAVFWCRLMQKKESKSKNYNASDNRAKTQKRGEKILTCNVLNMRFLRKGSCKWKHLCTYSLHKCLLCTGKSVRVLVKYIFIMSPVFHPHLVECFWNWALKVLWSVLLRSIFFTFADHLDLPDVVVIWVPVSSGFCVLQNQGHWNVRVKKKSVLY